MAASRCGARAGATMEAPYLRPCACALASSSSPALRPERRGRWRARLWERSPRVTASVFWPSPSQSNLAARPSCPKKARWIRLSGMRFFRAGLEADDGCLGPCAFGLGLCRDGESIPRLRELLFGNGRATGRWGALAALTILEPETWLSLLKRNCFRAAIRETRRAPLALDVLAKRAHLVVHFLDETVFPYTSADLDQVLSALADKTLLHLLRSTQADCRVEAAIELTRRAIMTADQHVGDLALFDSRDVIRLLQASLDAENAGGARSLSLRCLEAGEWEVRLAAAMAVLAS